MTGFPDELLFAKTLNSPGKRGRVCGVNMTRRAQIIKSGQLSGQAVQVKEISPPFGTVLKVQFSMTEEPDHIAPLLDDIRVHAPSEIADEAMELIKDMPMCMIELTLTLKI